MQNYFSAIRCPNERPHNKYLLCGNILGIVHNKELYLYCDSCKQFFKINITENDNIEMVPVQKNIRFKLKTSQRVII
jgi:uncharacterized pyridoxamine 5'-phosphate oxidase family protein